MLQKGGPGRERLWVLMDSTDAEKVIVEQILEGSPRFWALLDAYVSTRGTFLLCRTDLILLSFKPVTKQE